MLESPKNPRQHSYSDDIWQGQQNAGDREIVITCDLDIIVCFEGEGGPTTERSNLFVINVTGIKTLII